MRSRTALAIVVAALIACIVIAFEVLPQLFGNGVTISPTPTPSATTNDQPT